jgi:phenylalanyl-tRNA synthetase beta chain
MAQLAGGNVATGRVDNFPSPKAPASIIFRPERANAMLGLSLTAERMAELFRNLEFQVQPVSNGSFQVTIPSYRIDIEREIDLIEEICRLNGFDQVVATMPVAQVVSDRPSLHQRLQRSVRDHFVAEGMHEIVSFSFIAADAADRINLNADDPRRNGIKLCNPLAAEQAVMRTTLLPGLLETTARNMSFRSLDLRLFEMRRVYHLVPDQEMPHEPVYCAGLISGTRDKESWCQQAIGVDFYDAKGIVENLFELLQIRGVRWSSEEPEPFYHPGKCCRIVVGNSTIGTIGEIHPEVLKRYEIEQSVYYFELNFEELVRLSGGRKAIAAPSRFPDSVRDLALLAPLDLPSAQLIDCVKSLKLQELEKVTIFDLYQGDRVPEGYKSIALRLRYRAAERTMTDDEVQLVHQKVVNALTGKLGLSVR